MSSRERDVSEDATRVGHRAMDWFDQSRMYSRSTGSLGFSIAGTLQATVCLKTFRSNCVTARYGMGHRTSTLLALAQCHSRHGMGLRVIKLLALSKCCHSRVRNYSSQN